MDQRHENFQKLFGAVYLVLSEVPKHRYLPEWLYSFWQSEGYSVVSLIDAIKLIEKELPSETNLSILEERLIKLLDQERYLSAVHLKDEKRLNRIQDAMVTALFFSQEDIKMYDKLILIEQEPEKFIEYLNRRPEIATYEEYLKKQQSVFGRFIQNFTEEEISNAAKAQMINGKLLDDFELEKFLTHGFYYVKQELKALSIHKIEKGFLNQERIDSYLEKISFLLHPANELQQNTAELIKQARYLLEDIINTAGLKEHGVPNYPEHEALINGCYWVDEMFKTAVGENELSHLS